MWCMYASDPPSTASLCELQASNQRSMTTQPTLVSGGKVNVQDPGAWWAGRVARRDDSGSSPGLDCIIGTTSSREGDVESVFVVLTDGCDTWLGAASEAELSSVSIASTGKPPGALASATARLKRIRQTILHLPMADTASKLGGMSDVSVEVSNSGDCIAAIFADPWECEPSGQLCHIGSATVLPQQVWLDYAYIPLQRVGGLVRFQRMLVELTANIVDQTNGMDAECDDVRQDTVQLDHILSLVSATPEKSWREASEQRYAAALVEPLNAYKQAQREGSSAVSERKMNVHRAAAVEAKPRLLTELERAGKRTEQNPRQEIGQNHSP